MNINDSSCGCGDYPLLQKINNPALVKELSKEQQIQLAQELRQCIIHTVSKGGGHLAPSLGVIELTIALFKCFDFNTDRLVWM